MKCCLTGYVSSPNNRTIINLLIEAGIVNVNSTKYTDGQTFLQYYFSRNDYRFDFVRFSEIRDHIMYFIEKGADINSVDEHGSNAAMNFCDRYVR